MFKLFLCAFKKLSNQPMALRKEPRLENLFREMAANWGQRSLILLAA
jgi:hypothetical protein